MDNYLPHINAAEGIARIMNNKALYVKMLTRFKLQEMSDSLKEAAAQGDDFEKIVFAAHAIKGASANLGLPTLAEITGTIEQHAKEKKDVAHLIPELEELVAVLQPLLEEFVANEG